MKSLLTTTSILLLAAIAARQVNGFVLPAASSRGPPLCGDHHQLRAGVVAVDQEDDSAAAAVEFPPPLTPVQRTKRAFEFYRRVLPVLAAYKAREVEVGLRKPTAAEEERMWAELDEWGSSRVAEAIQEMKGFYVKTGQVISTRVDLFPEAYTSKLQELQDGIEPMPFEMVRRVVEQELLHGAPLAEIFSSFEEAPLGSASIAQVHKATLLDGRVVAVKLQRPNVEPKLLGDVANLKRISKALAKQLPVDYYTVFCELGDALEKELDFLAEAQAMRKIDLAISHDNDGRLCERPVTVPLPVGELVSKRVLVMDFIEGIPLNRLQETMKERGIEPGSPESKIAGRRILDSLALAFGRMIFGAGFIHGDPHPGNIFVGEGASVSLIDCGQFKALPRQQRLQLAELVLAVDEYQRGSDEERPVATKKLAGLVRGFGVTFLEGKQDDDDLACAVALLLFGNADQELPGGYSTNELSDMSPIKQVASFPQELVLMGRATVLLKGIAKRLGVDFSLAQKWGDGCRLTLSAATEPSLPLWGRDVVKRAGGGDSANKRLDEKLRFREVTDLFKEWAKGKGVRFSERIIKKMPPETRTRFLEWLLERQERKAAKKNHS
jgi:aarF domain-containing kinase